MDERRCDNASRKGKAMTMSSYSCSKGSELSYPRVIQITFLSALVTMLLVVNVDSSLLLSWEQE